MYQSKKSIENRSYPTLCSYLENYLSKHRYVYTKALRRKVFLDKLPEAIIDRKSTRKKRLQCFIVACDILKESREHTMRFGKKKQREYEIRGFSHDGQMVTIHVREEVSKEKNKKLFFVSCYFSSK